MKVQDIRLLRLIRGPALAQAGVLVTLVIAALFFRLAGRDWDMGLQLNVDDSFVSKTALKRVTWPPGTPLSSFFDPSASPLNPRANGDFYPYGTLPIYVANGASNLMLLVTSDQDYAGIMGVQRMGRTMSGIFDTLTMLMVVGLGAHLWGRWPGLMAGALYAFAILPIQVSHFFISDSFMAAFMAATLLCATIYYSSGRVWLVPLGGVCAGLALACKLSAAPMLALPLIAVALRVWTKGLRTEDKGGTEIKDGTTKSEEHKTTHSSFVFRPLSIRQTLLLAVSAIAGTLAGFFPGDPYALLDSAPYLAQVGEQAAIQSGAIDEWFTRKYVGTWPLLHGLGQLILLGVGPLVGIAGLLWLLWPRAIYGLWVLTTTAPGLRAKR